MSPRLALVFLLAAIGCDGEPARVSLAPIDHPCGRPAGARNVRITAYAPSQEKRVSVAPDESIDVADFPSDTEQLAIEIEVGGGTVGAAGKTTMFDFLGLDDGEALPIFLAPPNGYCPTVGPMTAARIAPLVARAGDGVLVVGGRDTNGVWLRSAEYYDFATSTFSPIELPLLLQDTGNTSGFGGMSLATLPDGRVAMSGGFFAQLLIFDPASRTFVSSSGIEPRVGHASIAISDDEILVAGGCPTIADGACPVNSMPRLSTRIYDVANTLEVEVGPNLAVSRLGATLFDAGLQRDGRRAFVLAGGTAKDAADSMRADRLALGIDEGSALVDVRTQAAALDGGSVLTAFAPDGAADGTATIIAPRATTARSAGRAPDLDGARLVTLEDGRVLGIGGAANGDVALYDPTVDRWQSVTPAGSPPAGPLVAPSLVRLPDGAVLVLGSAIGGEATASAWIYRPSIVGPAIGAITVLPLDDNTGVLTAEDPATVTRAFTPLETWTLTATDTLARALVGGPRRSTGSVTASVRLEAGDGIALVGQQLAPGRALVGELVQGRPARIVRLDGATDRTLCSGREVPPLVRADLLNVTVKLEVASGTVRLSVEGSVLASCDVDVADRGAWGVAALPGSTVTVAQVTVAR